MANKGKKKVKGRDAAGSKKRTASSGSGTVMAQKKTLKSIPSDGGRASVMAQKKGDQGTRMTRTITRRTAPLGAARSAGASRSARGPARGPARGAARGATIGAMEGMSRIPFRNSFIERIRSRQQD